MLRAICLPPRLINIAPVLGVKDSIQIKKAAHLTSLMKVSASIAKSSDSFVCRSFPPRPCSWPLPEFDPEAELGSALRTYPATRGAKLVENIKEIRPPLYEAATGFSSRDLDRRINELPAESRAEHSSMRSNAITTG